MMMNATDNQNSSVTAASTRSQGVRQNAIAAFS
jgi:hypothetical protein